MHGSGQKRRQTVDVSANRFGVRHDFTSDSLGWRSSGTVDLAVRAETDSEIKGRLTERQVIDMRAESQKSGLRLALVAAKSGPNKFNVRRGCAK
jgi:hypothetical protein